jgi:predicted unusual protein kinase regulating ubiquinone biosynthesis (AarF/ABC1/UbiB family)
MSFSHVLTWLTLGIQLSGYYVWYRLFCWNLGLFYQHSLRLLRDKNILFTKIFQSLSDNVRIDMSPEFRTELTRYKANVSYTEDEIDYETIDAVEAEYKVRVDRRVVNSGMIALVFHCTKPDEESQVNNAVLKLKRRHITEHLRSGCESVAFMYRLAAYWFPRNIYIRVLRPFIANLDDIIEQCDFDREIQNTREAKEDFAELEHIQIPTVYNRADATNNAFILMERIHGTHALPANTSEEDRERYFQYFTTFSAYSLLSNAMQHTDLHAGNIIFKPDGLGIIDFGMSLRLSDEAHEILLSIADIVRGEVSLDSVDPSETFRHLFDPVLAVEDITDMPRFRAICREIMTPLIERVEIDELSITDSLENLSASLNQDISLNQEFYKVVLAITMMHGEALILGHTYANQARVSQLYRNCIQAAYLLIM